MPLSLATKGFKGQNSYLRRGSGSSPVADVIGPEPVQYTAACQHEHPSSVLAAAWNFKAALAYGGSKHPLWAGKHHPLLIIIIGMNTAPESAQQSTGLHQQNKNKENQKTAPSNLQSALQQQKRWEGWFIMPKFLGDPTRS